MFHVKQLTKFGGNVNINHAISCWNHKEDKRFMPRV